MPPVLTNTYNDIIMIRAVGYLREHSQGPEYKDFGWRAEDYGLVSHNCQDFVDAVRQVYRLIASPPPPTIPLPPEFGPGEIVNINPVGQGIWK